MQHTFHCPGSELLSPVNLTSNVRGVLLNSHHAMVSNQSSNVSNPASLKHATCKPLLSAPHIRHVSKGFKTHQCSGSSSG